MHTRKASCTSLVLLIFVHWLGVKVMSMDTLKQGDQLNSSSRLVSQNGAFAFGFHTLVYTNNTYLAIWSTYQPSSPVWMANRDHPFHNNSSPVLTLATGGELLITLHEGDEPPFMVHGGGSRQNVTATLMNTGNFVVNSTNGELLWQSFDHPTDTLLPGMKLGIKLGLSSWLEQSNPVSGAFTLEWDLVSRTLIIRRRGIVYWMSERLEDLKSTRGNKLKNLYEKNFNYSDGDEYVTFTPHVLPWLPHNRKFVVWWTLQYEGILVDNSYGNVIAMADECYGYNTNWGTDEGCMIRHVPKCRHHRGKFELRLGDFRPINGTSADMSVRDANSSLSSSDCRDFCWKDCDCVGYDKSDGDGCVYWRGRDSKFQQNLDGSNMMIKRYVLVSTHSTKGIKKHIQIIILGVVASVVLIILGLSYFILRKVRKGKTEEAQLDQLLTLEGYTEMLENGGGKSNELKIFSYASIVTATSNFSSDNKLGEGGFGPVYKGRTVEGQDIAVKVLSRQSGQGLLEFKTELVLISKLQHVNLVKLQGFCIHGDDKMIIYDYMHNKSLDFFLFSESKREQLDWQKRFNIIEGTAHGLLYLHKYSRLRIIHRDLKPSNILLDQNMTPKISDFGLARIFKQNVSEANTNRRVGTYGYMAPEYAMQGLFSDKSDVYSFGVLVLEIVSGRKINSFHEIEGPLSIVEYAWELWRKDCAVELMDPALKDCCIVDQLQICIQIGLLCVENLAADRPAIEDVVSMLKNETSALPMPKNPSFIKTSSVLQLVDKSKTIPEKLSANDATITEMQGR